MIVTRELQELRQHRAAWSGTVGCVPTMGALHRGHQALMQAARSQCDRVVVTIFVNPTQFAPGEDFAAYPRTEEDDLRLCRESGVDLVWLPEVGQLYPPGSQTVVDVGRLGQQWEGASRPGHFQGVATVVTKLFLAVQPTHAYFGRKDRQQLEVIRVLVRDLLFPVEVVAVPTVREPGGLALSSRNRYLDSEQREQASRIYEALTEVDRLFAQGQRQVAALEQRFRAVLERIPGALVERFDVLAPDWSRAYAADEAPSRATVCVAVRWAGVRLLDEWELEEGASCY